jgi:hypothetical protein
MFRTSNWVPGFMFMSHIPLPPQSLQLYATLPCSQVLLPPQSLQTRYTFPCSQNSALTVSGVSNYSYHNIAGEQRCLAFTSARRKRIESRMTTRVHSIMINHHKLIDFYVAQLMITKATQTQSLAPSCLSGTWAECQRASTLSFRDAARLNP